MTDSNDSTKEEPYSITKLEWAFAGAALGTVALAVNTVNTAIGNENNADRRRAQIAFQSQQDDFEAQQKVESLLNSEVSSSDLSRLDVDQLTIVFGHDENILFTDDGYKIVLQMDADDKETGTFLRTALRTIKAKQQADARQELDVEVPALVGE